MPSTWNDIELLIVGAGTMGASLAQNYAQNGFTVGMLDVSPGALQLGFSTIERELERAQGRIFSPAETAAIRGRILGGTSYEEACRSTALRLVIEAATERVDIKQEIFGCLDSLTAPEVVLATNSSSLNTNLLARATRRPDKIVWMHYFYLPHKNRAAEYAGTDTASDASIAVARKYLKLGGKIPTRIQTSRKGGVADIIFVALLLEATRMLEERFSIAAIEAAGKKAYGIPIGFLELMDATGLPIGLYSMKSFSDASDRADPLYKAYGNFFTPRKNYVDLIDEYTRATDKASVRWIRNGRNESPDAAQVEQLADRFLAIGFLTATECVDSGLITIDDLELLAQNAFLWNKGPFSLMHDLGTAKVASAVRTRADLAKSFGQDFPVCDLLKRWSEGSAGRPYRFTPVTSEQEHGSAVRRITLTNPRAANAMDNRVFEELNRQFSEANDDPRCKVIIFDTAPIKSFIAGADVKLFLERIRAKDFDAILRDTAEWQRIMFHIMTGTPKPKIAIVDGQAFGGGVEVACAFALDPSSIVLITNRTSFALPETRLGIYPGLRGTLSLPQLIHRKLNDAETAVALARYFTLAGLPASSPQVIMHLGCADAIVPQQLRDEAADAIARAILANNGKPLTRAQLDALPFPRMCTAMAPEHRMELHIAQGLFSAADLLPTLYAQARGHLPIFHTGEMKATAERMARRVAENSPNAVAVSQYLISRGFEKFLAGSDSDTLAAFELEHHLRQVFEHPDALIGLEAMTQGRPASFRRRYPL